MFQNILESEQGSVDYSISSNIIKKILSQGSEFREQVIVIALDSHVIQNEVLLDNFIENIHLISKCGATIFIVHDYINLIEHTFNLFEISNSNIRNFSTMNNKDAQMVEMVLSGYINKNIVTKLCDIGCYALGISGKDGSLIQARKSKILNKRYNEDGVIDIGFMYEPEINNPDILASFGDMSIIPVIAPIASDETSHTQILDMNLTAIKIAIFLNAQHLILARKNNSSKIEVNLIKTREVKILKNILNMTEQKQQIIHDNIINFLELGNNYIHLVNPDIVDNILLTLFSETCVS